MIRKYLSFVSLVLVVIGLRWDELRGRGPKRGAS